MSLLFEELDYCPTPIGALSLRRRRELSLNVDVFEIKLGEEFLMSSLFTASEIALAELGLAALPGDNLDIVVGLGYTAQAAMKHKTVGSLVIVEMLEAVIGWHRAGLVPLGPELVADVRCRFVQGDFFAMADSAAGFDPDAPRRRFDVILVRPMRSLMTAAPASISLKVSARLPPISNRAASSGCGRTTGPTRASQISFRAFSPMPGRSR